MVAVGIATKPLNHGRLVWSMAFPDKTIGGVLEAEASRHEQRQKYLAVLRQYLPRSATVYVTGIIAPIIRQALNVTNAQNDDPEQATAKRLAGRAVAKISQHYAQTIRLNAEFELAPYTLVVVEVPMASKLDSAWMCLGSNGQFVTGYADTPEIGLAVATYNGLGLFPDSVTVTLGCRNQSVRSALARIARHSSSHHPRWLSTPLHRRLENIMHLQNVKVVEADPTTDFLFGIATDYCTRIADRAIPTILGSDA